MRIAAAQLDFDAKVLPLPCEAGKKGGRQEWEVKSCTAQRRQDRKHRRPHQMGTRWLQPGRQKGDAVFVLVFKSTGSSRGERFCRAGDRGGIFFLQLQVLLFTGGEDFSNEDVHESILAYIQNIAKDAYYLKGTGWTSKGNSLVYVNKFLMTTDKKDIVCISRKWWGASPNCKQIAVSDSLLSSFFKSSNLNSSVDCVL